MVDIIIKVLTPATSIDLMTLDEARLMILNMPGGIPPTDEQLAQMITQYSALVGTLCNRKGPVGVGPTLGYQTVRETWRDFEPPYNTASRRLFLSQWPVKEEDVTSVQAPRGTVLDPSGYEIEEGPGKIELFNGGGGGDPIVAEYSGGYKLPEEAPPELKQAVGLMIRQYRFQNVIASGVRSVAHKESRVQYFSPRDMVAVQPVGGTAVNITSTIDNLLSHYRRVEV
jgi:hypothetical protein